MRGGEELWVHETSLECSAGCPAVACILFYAMVSVAVAVGDGWRGQLFFGGAATALAAFWLSPPRRDMTELAVLLDCARRARLLVLWWESCPVGTARTLMPCGEDCMRWFC